MALAIDASSPANATAINAADAITTASFTPPASSRLWAFSGFGRTGTGATVAVTSSPALTWTNVTTESTQKGASCIAWADVSTSQAYTVTATASGGTAADQGRSLKVQVITGGEATPGGANNKSNGTATSPSVGLTSTRNSSILMAMGTDWNGNSGITAGATQTILHQHYHGGFYTGTHWRYDGTPTAGAYTLGLTGGGSQLYNFTAVEIREPVAVGGKIKIVGGTTKPTKIFPGGIEKPVKLKEAGGAWVLV